MIIKKLICLAFFAASLAACGQAGAPAAQTAKTPALETSQKTEQVSGVGQQSRPEESQDEKMTVQLNWEDLMPEGEDVVLERLYREFYDNLEGQIGGAQTLASAAQSQGESLDIAEIIEGSAEDTMEQIGTFNVVEDLNGEKIRIPGYVVPLDFSAKSEYTEFLLVPYFGACLHTPPPPPNQIIFVKALPAVKLENIYEPIWLEGTMRTGQFNSGLGNSAYEVSLSKAEAYEY